MSAMPDKSTAPDEPIQAALAPRPKPMCCAWLAWPAWLAILGMAGFLVYHQMQRAENAEQKGDKVDINGRVQQTVLRSLIGVQRLAKAGDDQQDAAKIAEALAGFNQGPLYDRVRCIVAIADVAGPEEGTRLMEALRELAKERMERKEMSLSGGQIVVLRGVDHVFEDRAAKRFTLPSVTRIERELLKERLGWFGELALLPPEAPDELQAKRTELLESATQSGLIFIGVGVLALVLALLAVAAVAVFVVKLARGTLTLRFETGSGHGGVYAETFALWLGAVLGLGWLAEQFLDHVPDLLRSGGVALASLLVLVWPVLRGVRARQVREDLGWSTDTNPLMDLWAGFIVYVANLPVVAAAMVVSVVFLLPLLNPPVVEGATADPFASPVVPSHPVVGRLADADWRDLLPVLLLAAVIAPIVEEVMFRGVLYRHLREATAGWGRFASWLSTTLLTSLLFAAIHPQGFAAVPLLMSLACGFCFMREWRGALLPSIFAHSMNNATLVTLAFFLLN